jgi:hypothetical protein
MDLDIKQTRRIFLAGTVAFPTPFPSAGGISIEEGSFRLSEDRQRATFVVVQEKSPIRESTIRVVQISHVAAIFFPGVWVDTDKGPVFRFAKQDGVHDLDEGEWFVGPHVETGRIVARLKLAESNIDITRRDSGVRGIVFVQEHRPLLTIDECAQSAGEAAMEMRGHCFGPAMESFGPYLGPGKVRQRRYVWPDFFVGRC